MSKRSRTTEREPEPQTTAAAEIGAPELHPAFSEAAIQAGVSPDHVCAVIDPPESGPPTAEELGQAEPKLKEDVDHGSESTAIPTEGQQVAEPTTPAPAEKKVIRGPDCSTIVANLDRPSAPAWPADSPFKVDWPWSGEPDPVPGDIVGWNWERREIAVVTAVPPVTQPWPYTLTVEIRPMPEEWLMGPVKVFDLNSGQRLDVEWYTRWNRAYSQFVMDASGCPIADESGKDVKRTTGSGWLAVVQEGR